jgi:hypothetical protein
MLTSPPLAGRTTQAPSRQTKSFGPRLAMMTVAGSMPSITTHSSRA